MVWPFLVWSALATECRSTAVYFLDSDYDGYGNARVRQVKCLQPWGYLGWSLDARDCDDHDPDWQLACPPGIPETLSWGDPHAHTNLSQDGCEAVADECLPEGGQPAELLYDNAAAGGLAWVAMTDHAENTTYEDLVTGVTLDVWDAQQAVVAAAEGGPVLPVLGYEYTADFGHRTVVFDELTVCPALRKAVDGEVGTKEELGLEHYELGPSDGYTTALEFEEGMVATAATAECAGPRWLAWPHHPAYRSPAMVKWNDAGNRVAYDTVVEIASEHGSSECADLSWDGCDFRSSSSLYSTLGSVQTALSLGYRLGFVGGSDNHEATGARLGDGPGAVGHFVDSDGDGLVDTARVQYADGAVTGVLHTGELTRTAIFDAIEARHTVASTWLFEGLEVYAFDAAGTTWLPGDDIPADAGTLYLRAELDDASVSSWYAELVDPTTGATEAGPAFTVGPGEVRYVRIRAWVDGVEQRVWASPFFGE